MRRIDCEGGTPVAARPFAAQVQLYKYRVLKRISDPRYLNGGGRSGEKRRVIALATGR